MRFATSLITCSVLITPDPSPCKSFTLSWCDYLLSHVHLLTRINRRCSHVNALFLRYSYTFNLIDVTEYVHKELTSFLSVFYKVTAQQYHFHLNKVATFLSQNTNLSVQSGPKPYIFTCAKRLLLFESEQTQF